jgi:hypothetical protein
MNIMDHTKFCGIVDRLQNLLNNDPYEFEMVVDDIDEVI